MTPVMRLQWKYCHPEEVTVGHSRNGGYVASAGMSGGWHKDRVYLSTALAPVLSLHSPRTQAPDIPAEATCPPLRLYLLLVMRLAKWE